MFPSRNGEIQYACTYTIHSSVITLPFKSLYTDIVLAVRMKWNNFNIFLQYDLRESSRILHTFMNDKNI